MKGSENYQEDNRPPQKLRKEVAHSSEKSKSQSIGKSINETIFDTDVLIAKLVAKQFILNQF